MIYSLTLQTAGLVTGVALLIAHFIALCRSEETRKWLKQFPRSRSMGTLLIALAAIWSFLLITGMDLGEFTRLRNVMLVAIVAGAFLAWKYVEEFLAVRAIGMLALLAAEPLLEAAFMRPETTRLLLVQCLPMSGSSMVSSGWGCPGSCGTRSHGSRPGRRDFVPQCGLGSSIPAP